MRQITADSIRAFNNSQRFKRGNTEVTVYVNYFGEVRTELRLHGNLIAVKEPRGVFINTCGYMTTTTKERLNGLSGVHIQQKNFVWYLNGNKWNGDAVKLEDWGLFTPA
tara:strand:+ start:10200 stop:10526 length:327 start_codon:yes stop_codon:yes gene_type:complete